MQKKAIALTGGIGSGKSFVANCLKNMGIEVFDCDASAKYLMNNNSELKQDLLHLIGPKAYLNGQLNKKEIAAFLLANPKNAQALNNIVHPAVAKHFLESQQEWIESAILFESSFDKRIPLKASICVVAPLQVRIERIMKRDNISEKQAVEWVSQQMPQSEKAKKANFVVVNDGKENITEQLIRIIEQIKK